MCGFYIAKHIHKMDKFATRIQRAWKKYGSLMILRKIVGYLRTELTQEGLQELSNKCQSISQICKGDGAGLLGGALIDMYICRFFQTRLREYQEYHCGESDMKLCGIPLSQKKISGKSTVALDWSKNPTDAKKESFRSHILIINLKTEQWWKSRPRPAKPAIQGSAGGHSSDSESLVEYNQIMPSGIFLVDKYFCKQHIALSSNNKTNTLIDSKSLYRMLHHSVCQNLYVEIPPPNETIPFDILHAFAPPPAPER